jgi:flagellar hook protein FlgE
MGLFDALTSAVSGLQAQSYAMQNISGNIANSQTIAYKGVDTSFEDLIPGAGVPSQQVAGGVIANSVTTNSVQGAIATATSPTDMAVNGDGYFVVQAPTAYAGTTPVFGGVDSYTRRGDFTQNSAGYLVNGSGYYLEGIPLDPTTGNPTGNVAAPLQFQNSFLPAVATTQINYGINLPTTPQTASYLSTAPGSELLNPVNFTRNPTMVTIAATNAVVTGTTALGSINASGGAITFNVNGQTVTLATNGGFGSNGIYSASDLVGAINTQVGVSAKVNATLNGSGELVLTSTNTAGSGDTVTVGTFSSGSATQLGFAGATATAIGTNALPATGTVVGNDVTAFTKDSISGGSVTAYNSNGTPVNIQLQWAKIANADPSATPPVQDTWNLFYQTNSSAAGTQVAWQNVGTNFVFNSAGQLNPPITNLAINNVSVNGVSLGNITMNSPTGSLTQFSSTSGTTTVNSLQQNGYPAGQLQSIAVNNNGVITGTFSNGQNVNLAEVPLVHFNSPDSLKSVTGGAYEATQDSGAALAGASGKIVGQSLEGSNTDIATEFTKLIVTQQAYSANTKVITTANQMSQDLLNILR